MNRRILLVITLVMLPLLPTVGQESDDVPVHKPTWSPRPVGSELVNSVINGNLFVPNQRRAPRVETKPGEADNPTKAEDTQTSQPPIDVEPENPDRRYRLIGTSSDTGRWVAFIENTETDEVFRVALDEEIARGSVALISYDRIEYSVNGQVISVLIGRDLTGEIPQPSLGERLDNLFMSDSTTTEPDNSTETSGTNSENSPSATPSDADAQRAEILRRLRERRQRDSQ